MPKPRFFVYSEVNGCIAVRVKIQNPASQPESGVLISCHESLPYNDYMLQERNHLFPTRTSIKKQIECLNGIYGGDVGIVGLRKLEGLEARTPGGEWRFHPDRISGMYPESVNIIDLKNLRYV